MLENKKSLIKLLAIPSDRAGVGHWRTIDPALWLQRMYPDEFEVTIDYEPKWDDDNYIKQFDIVHCHRTPCQFEKVEELVKKLNSFGIPLISDIDDYFTPGKAHPAYFLVMEEKLPEKIIHALKHANYVSTTTKIFADEIKKQGINKNVVIFPNAVDGQAKQWTPNPEPSNGKVRIGWLGGSSHLSDLEILRSAFQSLSYSHKDKIQTVLCGYDLRGTVTEIDQNGNKNNRPVQPLETCWYKYEQIFTNNYKLISDPEYIKFLHKFKQEKFAGEETKEYRRVWTKPLSTFSLNYNLFDISLAPVITNDGKFNLCKSQLKVIEAGFHKKALICTDFGPYQIDMKHGENGFLVNNNSGNKGWGYYMKKLIDNPQMIEDFGNALYETVKVRYDIRTVTTQRREFYKEVVNDMKSKNTKELAEQINNI